VVPLHLSGCNPNVDLVGKLGEVLTAQHQDAEVLASHQGRHDLVVLTLPTAHAPLL
jgi:hypothetical protein